MSNDTARDPVHAGEAARWGGWKWRPPRGGEHYRTCSYCGSIHPADLAAETSWRADWADMKYGWPHKFYVNVTNRNPGQRFIIGASTIPEDDSTNPDDPTGLTWIPTAELPPDVNLDGWLPGGETVAHLARRYPWVAVGARPAHFAKFYTIHLADPDLPYEVTEAVQQHSGLRFTFTGDRVMWQRWRPVAES